MRFVPTTEFWVSRIGRTRDGLKGECKECAKARRRICVTPEREARYNRAKYLADPEGFKRRAVEYEARKTAAFVERVDPLVVLERADGVCGICFDDVDPLRFDVDHIYPLSLGGDHSYVNTQPAHPSCNGRKRARVLV